MYRVNRWAVASPREPAWDFRSPDRLTLSRPTSRLRCYMTKSLRMVSLFGLLILCLATSVDAQRGQGGGGPRPGQLGGAVTAHYPPVFFREDFKFDKSVPNQNNEREPEHTISPGDVANPNLEVRLYGDKAGTRTVLQPYNDDITYVMSLLCTSNWAITLRDKNNDVDLTGLATIRWRTRVSGFHLLRPILKLANGTWLIGDKTAGFST